MKPAMIYLALAAAGQRNGASLLSRSVHLAVST